MTVEVGGRAPRHRARAGARRPLRAGGRPDERRLYTSRRGARGLALSAHPPEPARVAPHASTSRAGVSFWRKALAFAGPGYMVAVGYMDPGNWATDLAGGARFGYTLLSVILISNLMAILLQALAAQARHRDRARPGAGLPRPLLAPGELRALGALRDRHRRLRPGRGDRLGDRAEPAVRHPADLGRLPHRARRAADPAAAEQGLPLPRGARDRAGGRRSASASRSSCFWRSRPSPRCWAGCVPTTEIVTNPAMLYIAIGILGATVMPHNLYLHSLHRADAEGTARRRVGKREAITLRHARLDGRAAVRASSSTRRS